MYLCPVDNKWLSRTRLLQNVVISTVGRLHINTFHLANIIYCHHQTSSEPTQRRWSDGNDNVALQWLTIYQWKKALSETQTLCAGCSKAGPKIFAPLQTPFPGMQDGQNLMRWRWSLPSPTDPVWWRSMHAIASYCGSRPISKQTHRQTGPITIHCATKLSTQCNKADSNYEKHNLWKNFLRWLLN